ncbi:hypothetical protein LJC18_00900 [Lachnospiraceae bacterium OttesenSCG-928-E19]|nr:hypothetical protein [Lachnospiraceae bacterium OttesenSCG-928-E19]
MVSKSRLATVVVHNANNVPDSLTSSILQETWQLRSEIGTRGKQVAFSNGRGCDANKSGLPDEIFWRRGRVVECT